MNIARVEIYQDRHNEWRWRLKAKNNEIIAISSEGYATKSNAKRGWLTVEELLENDLAIVDVPNSLPEEQHERT